MKDVRKNKLYAHGQHLKPKGMRGCQMVLCLGLSLILTLPLVSACSPRDGNLSRSDSARKAVVSEEQKTAMDGAQIREDTEYLCDSIGIRVQGSQEEREAAQWILERLIQCGFSQEQDTLAMEEFLVDGTRSCNIEAVCNRDKTGKEPVICVMAHFDSVPDSPGAQDNGASIGILLNMAKILGPENSDYSTEIRLLFLGAEENGYHGSKEYVKGLSEQERRRLKTVFNMDISVAALDSGAVLVCNTLGRSTEQGYAEGDIFEPAVSRTTLALQEAYCGLYDKNGKVPVFHYGDSDHLSFHQAGIEAVNVCYRRVQNGMPLLPEEYHLKSDTPEKIDYDTAEVTGNCILRAIEMMEEED